MHRREFIEGTVALVAGSALTTAAGGTGDLTAADYRATRRFVDTPFGRIACVERGAGDTALFLHGFPLSGFQWRGALSRLAPWRRCIAPDFLGLGHTLPAAGSGFGPDDQVAMLVALMDRLGIAAADLVASDSGGAVAQLLMARHPERVRTVLLTNCDTEIDCPPPALLPVIELARAGRFVPEWLGTWLGSGALARSPEGIGGMCYADPAHPTDEAIEEYFGPIVRSADRTAWTHAYAIALDRNVLGGVEPALRASRVPTRVLWGMDDSIFSVESPAYLDRTLGNSRGVRRLPGRKLFWPEELPGVIAQEAQALWGVR